MSARCHIGSLNAVPLGVKVRFVFRYSAWGHVTNTSTRGTDRGLGDVGGDQPPHELEFTADAAAWLTAIVEKDPTSPFLSASCEKRSRGHQLRRDLTLHGKDGRPLITGEVKLPYQKDGATPYHSDVVKDARVKATKARVDYFFTWNVNECVLWTTSPPPGVDARSHY